MVEVNPGVAGQLQAELQVTKKLSWPQKRTSALGKWRREVDDCWSELKGTHHFSWKHSKHHYFKIAWFKIASKFNGWYCCANVLIIILQLETSLGC